MAYLARKKLPNRCAFCGTLNARVTQVVDPNGKIRRRLVCLNKPCSRVNK